MRSLAGLVIALTGCGRIGFSSEPGSDGGNDASDAASDGSTTLTSRHWVMRENMSPPGALDSPGLAFDADRGTVLLFGGDLALSVPGMPQDGTWELTATGWQQLCTACLANEKPEPRVRMAMAYDPDHHRVLLFGGTDVGVEYGDLWAWSGATGKWTKQGMTGTLPTARQYVHFVHDPVHHRMLLIGGTIASSTVNEVYALDGNTWSLLPELAPGPIVNEGVGVTWDPIGQRVLVLGGLDLADEVWAFDGQWSTVCTSCTGLPRSHASLLTDRTTTYLTGGYNGANELADTRRLVGNVLQPRPNALGARDSLGGAYDAARDVIVIYGGNGDSCTGGNNCDETWELVLD